MVKRSRHLLPSVYELAGFGLIVAAAAQFAVWAALLVAGLGLIVKSLDAQAAVDAEDVNA